MRKKSYVGWIENFRGVCFTATLSDYKYQLRGIYKHPQDWAKIKVRITIEELSPKRKE